MTSVFAFEARLLENSILRFYVEKDPMVQCTVTESKAIFNAHFAKHCLVAHLFMQKSNETVAVAKSYVELKFCHS